MIFNLQNVNIFRDPPSTQRWEKLVKVHENRRAIKQSRSMFLQTSSENCRLLSSTTSLFHPAMGVWPGLTANEICPLIDCMTLWVFIVTKAQRFSSSYKLIENKKDDIFMCCITFLVFGGILSRCHWEPQKSTQVCGNTFKLKSSKAKLTFLIIQWRKLKEVPSG